jgi:L-arabinose isomerase
MSDGLRKPHVALLPLYLELYDRTLPHLLQRQEGFLGSVSALLRSPGIEVTVLPVCRTRMQVAEAVSSAEKQGADGIVTLHLAYSPSLEAAESLVGTSLPVLMLDTTPASSLGPGFNTDAVLENHGIHGVQDLASVLRRRGRAYSVIAGATNDPGLPTRVMSWARAARARCWLQGLRVAQIGGSFMGMGDFEVTEQRLRKTLGPTVVEIELSALAELSRKVTEEEIAGEKARDREAFDCSACEGGCWDRSNRIGLGLRRALVEAGTHAFSMNFASFDRSIGLFTVPFLEASKAMARGLGYAGEGDVLTASLVGVLNSCYGPTTFTEMFCPDWAGGRVFMSHMGECNPALAEDRPRLVEKPYAFGPAENPAVLMFPLRPGPAALVNAAPSEGDSLTIIAADVRVCDAELEPGLPDMPHFWIEPPSGAVAQFLERYSEAGGTHHLALTPGLACGELKPLADMLGCEFVLVP